MCRNLGTLKIATYGMVSDRRMVSDPRYGMLCRVSVTTLSLLVSLFLLSADQLFLCCLSYQLHGKTHPRFEEVHCGVN